MVGMNDSKLFRREDGLMDFDQSLPSKRNPFILSWGRLGIGSFARHGMIPLGYVTCGGAAGDRVAQIFSKGYTGWYQAK
jgi:hypothetical protein